MKPMPSPRGTNRAGLFIGGKVEAAYDAASTDADGNQIVDSALAHRILSACEGALDETDFSCVVDMLAKLDMISNGEVEALKSSGESNGGMASDAAMAFDAKAHIGRVIAKRVQQFQSGQRTYSSIFERVAPPHNAAADADFEKRFFPHQTRLAADSEKFVFPNEGRLKV